jgi:hypothetical protein
MVSASNCQMVLEGRSAACLEASAKMELSMLSGTSSGWRRRAFNIKGGHLKRGFLRCFKRRWRIRSMRTPPGAWRSRRSLAPSSSSTCTSLSHPSLVIHSVETTRTRLLVLVDAECRNPDQLDRSRSSAAAVGRRRRREGKGEIRRAAEIAGLGTDFTGGRCMKFAQCQSGRAIKLNRNGEV